MSDDKQQQLLEKVPRDGRTISTWDWDERVEPRRSEPDPHRMSDFLAKQLSKEQLERLVRWFR